MTKLQELSQLLISVQEDADKFEKGNKAAGTRLRKAMQEVKNLAQEIRKDVSEVKKTN